MLGKEKQHCLQALVHNRINECRFFLFFFWAWIDIWWNMAFNFHYHLIWWLRWDVSICIICPVLIYKLLAVYSNQLGNIQWFALKIAFVGLDCNQLWLHVQVGEFNESALILLSLINWFSCLKIMRMHKSQQKQQHFMYKFIKFNHKYYDLYVICICYFVLG